MKTSNVEQLKQRVQLWDLSTQKDLKKLLMKGNFRSLIAYEDDQGIIFVGVRVEKWVYMSCDK